MVQAAAAATEGRDSPPERRSVEFAFDARHKSIVKDVFALEARRLKSFFSRKPKVSLHQMETTLNQHASELELKKQIQGFVGSYYNNADHAHQFFESLGRLLLGAAAKEQEDGERQWYLLTQSLEMLRLAMQKSPKVLNIPAQSMIVSLTKIMGPAYLDVHPIEKAIHKEMMTMLNVKRDPNDLASRERIVKGYLQARQYYESLVHVAEYEKIMQGQSRSLHRQKKGEIAFRKASVFQVVIDTYQRMSAGKGGEDTNRKAELAKLQAFVTRFNRDNRRINIVPLKGLDIFSLNRTLHSVVAIANNFYAEAVRSEQFQAKHKAYFLMARNAYQSENYKGAQQILAEGVRVVEQARVPQKQKLGEKIRLLEFLYRIYTELGHQRKADETSAELANLRKEMRGAEMAASA
jgi:hypothetical protein